MGGRSGSAERWRLAAAVFVVMAAAACTATSPPQLPPRRVDFPPPAAASEVALRPTELAIAAEAPTRHETYWLWSLAANTVAVVPLFYWLERPEDIKLTAPALLLPPAVHAVHGEGRTAAVSLAMHAAMIGAVYLVGRGAENDDGCGSTRIASCLPWKWLFLTELAVIPVVVVDTVFMAQRARPASEWNRLPLLGATVSAGGGGGGMLTMSGRF